MKPTIAIVNPDYYGKSFDTISVPLGLAWISSYLKKYDYNTECFDFSIELSDKIKFDNKEFDYLFFSIHSEECYRDSFDQLREILSRKSFKTVIVGGPYASIIWKELICYSKIDYVVVGEGEVTVVDLLSILEDDGDKIDVKNARLKGVAFKHREEIFFLGTSVFVKNLNIIPLPDRESFSPERYPQWSIVTSRGCAFKCKFCTVPVINYKYRIRDVENVIDEISYLQKKYNVKKIIFLDDTFTFNKEWICKFCESLIDMKFNLRWSCFTRVDKVDKIILEKMKNSGCYCISYGIESLNEKTLQFLNKNFTINCIFKSIELTKKIGIRVRCSFIYGLPCEDKIDLDNTSKNIEKLSPDEVQIYPFMPYRNLKIYNDICGIQKNTYNEIGSVMKDALNPFVVYGKLSSNDIVDAVYDCVNNLKKFGYTWIPGDNKSENSNIDRIVTTVFCPIQSKFNHC